MGAQTYTLPELRLLAVSGQLLFDPRILEFAPSTLRSWAHRGRLTDHGHRNGRRLYDHDELVALLETQGATPRPTRRKLTH